jgi:glycosyltransferase involved in cell wall biosynthesis
VARFRQRPARALVLPPFALRALAGLRRLRPDALRAHWALPCGWPLGILASPPALDVTFHGADVRLLRTLPAPVRAHVVAQLLRAQRLRFVASSLLDALAAALPSPLASALLLRACVEPPSVAVEPRVPPAPLPWERYAVTLGRLIPSKRTELALRAVALAPGWGLVVLGDGPEQESLEQQARVLLPGRHRFAGRLPRPGALGYLAGASALLHPSAEEAAPTAVLEALALGVPVVSCGAGDTGRWARERGGLRVVEPEASALAGALRSLLAPTPEDPGHEGIDQLLGELFLGGAQVQRGVAGLVGGKAVVGGGGSRARRWGDPGAFFRGTNGATRGRHETGEGGRVTREHTP